MPTTRARVAAVAHCASIVENIDDVLPQEHVPADSKSQSVVSSFHGLLPCCTYSSASGSSIHPSGSWRFFEFMSSYGFAQLLVVLVLVAAFATTQITPTKRPVDVVFDALDLDNDGMLTAAELTPACILYIRNIKQTKRSIDGRLARAELINLKFRSFYSEDPQPGFKSIVAMLTRGLDKNSDGQLNEDELPISVIRYVETVDRNKSNDNGVLDAHELAGPGLWYWLNGEAWWHISTGISPGIGS